MQSNSPLEKQISQASRRVSAGMKSSWSSWGGLICCTRPGSWEWGIQLFLPFWLLFLGAGVYSGFCLPLSFHRAGTSAETPMLWRDSHRDVQFSSFPAHAPGVPRDPAQTGNIQVLWEHFSSPALNIWKPHSTDSQVLAKNQWHHCHLVRSLGRVFILFKDYFKIFWAVRLFL